MSAEAGFGDDSVAAPIRISGFVSALLGVLSAISVLGMPLLVIPLAGILLGLLALRKYGELKPVGVTAAKIGLVLSVGFGAFGFGVPFMKRQTLGHQGEAFAREFMKLAAMGEDYYCLELRKPLANRFLSSMPLEKHYIDENEEAMQSLEELRNSGAYTALQRLGPDAEWELDRATAVYYKYGREVVDIVYVNNSGKRPTKIRVVLEGYESKTTGAWEWHIDNFMIDRDRIVADTVL